MRGFEASEAHLATKELGRHPWQPLRVEAHVLGGAWGAAHLVVPILPRVLLVILSPPPVKRSRGPAVLLLVMQAAPGGVVLRK